jgi:hypothetical protein
MKTEAESRSADFLTEKGIGDAIMSFGKEDSIAE